MPQNKDVYNDAKRKALNRLNGWIQNTRRGSGIDRLLLEYPASLKRIGTVKNQSPELKKDTEFDIEPWRDTQPNEHAERKKAPSTRSATWERKKNESASADSVAAYTPSSNQRKTNSDNSLHDNGLESRKSRFSRRSSRLSPNGTPPNTPSWLHPSSRLSSNTPSRLHHRNPVDVLHQRKSSTRLGEPNVNLECQQPQIVVDIFEPEPKECVAEVVADPEPCPMAKSLVTRSRKKLSLKRSTCRGHLGLSSTPKSRDCSAKSVNLDVKSSPSVSIESYEGCSSMKLVKFFRKIFNIVMLFKCTIRQLSATLENTGCQFKLDDGQVLSFDPNDYQSCSKRFSGLTKRARLALRRSPGSRKADEIKCLLDVIGRLSVFKRYSKSVKEALADRLQYQFTEAGRIVIKQGYTGVYAYFVVSGVLGCKMEETDPRTGKLMFSKLPDVKKGGTFGELALKRELKRTATIYCKSDCELLCLSKDDFKDVLQDTWESEREDRLQFMLNSKYFSSWKLHELARVADVARTNHYRDNEVIVGNERSPFVYFITEGKCRLVKQIPLVRTKTPFRLSVLHLPEDTSRSEFLDKPYGRMFRRHDLHSYNLTVTELHEGNYIAAGEDLTDIYAVAKKKATCVCINLAQFEIFGKQAELAKMAGTRQQILPSTTSMYRQFRENRLWDMYKKQVVGEVIRRKMNKKRAALSDVPWSIRMEPRIKL